MKVNEGTSPLVGAKLIETDDGTLHILSPIVGECDCVWDDSDQTWHVPRAAIEPRETLTQAECSRVLGVSVSRVSRLCRNGMLKSTKVGSTWVIDGQSVREMLDDRNDYRLAGKHAN